MTEVGFNERDDSGDIVQLAQFIFDENSPPGRVQLETDSLGGLGQQFVFFCELYFTGAKLYNGIDFGARLETLDGLRPDTTQFLEQRMTRSLGVRPTLTLAPSVVAEQPPAIQYCFDISLERLEDNLLTDRLCGAELRMSFVYV